MVWGLGFAWIFFRMKALGSFVLKDPTNYLNIRDSGSQSHPNYSICDL